jgi:hypothetical protein
LNPRRPLQPTLCQQPALMMEAPLDAVPDSLHAQSVTLLIRTPFPMIIYHGALGVRRARKSRPPPLPAWRIPPIWPQVLPSRLVNKKSNPLFQILIRTNLPLRLQRVQMAHKFWLAKVLCQQKPMSSNLHVELLLQLRLLISRLHRVHHPRFRNLMQPLHQFHSHRLPCVQPQLLFRLSSHHILVQALHKRVLNLLLRVPNRNPPKSYLSRSLLSSSRTLRSRSLFPLPQVLSLQSAQ